MSFCIPGITHCEEHGNPIDLGYVCEECEEKRKLKDIDADKMFEELGYKRKLHKSYDAIRYHSTNGTITFWVKDKEISKNMYSEAGYITMQELKAINKKIEELGWI